MEEQARIVEGEMDCIEAVEVVSRTRLSIMVLYMENSGEWKSLPSILMLGIAQKVLNNIILIYI